MSLDPLQALTLRRADERRLAAHHDRFRHLQENQERRRGIRRERRSAAWLRLCTAIVDGMRLRRTDGYGAGVRHDESAAVAAAETRADRRAPRPAGRG